MDMNTKPFEWTTKEKVEVDGVTWFVTPSKGKSEGNFAFFLSLDALPDVQSGEMHLAFAALIEVIKNYDFVPRVCPDNRSFSIDGIKRKVGGHMVYANKPSAPGFVIKPKMEQS